jgi:hypothetical protein
LPLQRLLHIPCRRQNPHFLTHCHGSLPLIVVPLVSQLHCEHVHNCNGYAKPNGTCRGTYSFNFPSFSGFQRPKRSFCLVQDPALVTSQSQRSPV